MSAILSLFYNVWESFPIVPLFNMSMFLLCMLLFLAILKVRKMPKPAKNPFSMEHTKPAGEIEFDQKKRDAVIKQGFASKHIPEDLDAIIIGSGMGGLSCGCLMANAGKKVLVLEQHDQAGGCMHTFIEKGFEFDVGIHYIGEMGFPSTTKVLFDQLSHGQVQWEPLEEAFDKVVIGDPDNNPKTVNIYAGVEKLRKELVSKFPEEEANIDKILKLIRVVKGSVAGYVMVKTLPRFLAWLAVKTGFINYMTPYFKYSKMSVKQALDDCTDNKELKAVLSYCFGDYGTQPKDAPFTLHSSLLYHYFRGGYYPKGGSSEFAYHMVPVIEKSGGKVLVRARVSNIILNGNGKAHGVRVHKGGNDFDIFAPIIISDAGAFNTFTKLLPSPAQKKPSIQEIVKHCKHGNAGISVFIGLDGSHEELGLKPQNVWAFTSPNLDDEFDRFVSLNTDEVVETGAPLIFISFPSTKDSTWDQRYPGKATCEIITIGNYNWFKEWENERVMKRGDDYDSLKMAIGERLWQQAIKFFPQIADRRVYFDVGSPLSNNYYIASPRGEIYGLDHGRERFTPEAALALRSDTPIPGLFLTGQDTFCCGFSGAMYGGLVAASSVLARNCFFDLIKFTKEVRAAEKSKKDN